MTRGQLYDEVVSAVACAWTTSENEKKTMDTALAMAAVKNVMVVVDKIIGGPKFA